MKRDPLLIEGVAYLVYVVALIVWAYHSLPTVPR
jgi:hypothetical protein